MQQNAKDNRLPFYDIHSDGQGIVHVIGPQLGYTRPGMLIVCGDSHTSTHGAFGSMGMAIGTTQAEHVLATQCVQQANLKTMEVRLTGSLPPGVAAKDIILGIIGEIGIDGASGYAVEYTGEAIRGLSMEGRMTVCNMSIEAGARIGMVAPDETTFNYVKGRRFAPKGDAWEEAVENWQKLPTDAGAEYDRVLEIDASAMEPYVTWGTNPGMVARVTGNVPDPASMDSPAEKEATERALHYMGLEPGEAIEEIKIDRAFIGSCTNSRIEDLRIAAEVAKGRTVDPKVYAMVVPGSWAIKRQAEEEGLDRIFKDAGFDWREAGCSMCLGMNPDILQPGERCASTSNRNFEGRQGKGRQDPSRQPRHGGRGGDYRALRRYSGVEVGGFKVKLTVVLEPSDEGGYSVFVPTLPGCISEGDTREEALGNIREAIELYLELTEHDYTIEKDSEIVELAL